MMFSIVMLVTSSALASISLQCTYVLLSMKGKLMKGHGAYCSGEVVLARRWLLLTLSFHYSSIEGFKAVTISKDFVIMNNDSLAIL